MPRYDKNDPDIVEARALLAQMTSTHLIDTDERKQLRQRIAEELYGVGMNQVRELPRQTYNRLKEEGICDRYEEHETNEEE